MCDLQRAVAPVPDKSLEFRDYAAKEVNELAERLTKAAAATAERAAAAAAAEGRRALEALRAEMQAAVKQTAEDGQKVAETLRAELQNTVKQKTAVAHALKESQTQLQGVRGELEATRGELEATRGELDATRGDLDATGGQHEATRDALEATRGELDSTGGQLDATRGELESVRGEFDAVRRELGSARGELASARAENEKLSGAMESARAELHGTRGELKAALERGEMLSNLLADARLTNEKLEAVRDDLTLARDEEVRARAVTEAELRKLRESLDITGAALMAAETKLEKSAGDRAALEDTLSIAHSQTEAAEAKLSAVTDLFNKSAARVKVLEREQQNHERVVRELEARIKTPAAAPAAASAAVAPGPIFDDLLAGFQALESAATMSDVLTTLVEQLAAQFTRVALFRVRKSHLQGEHQIGFDLTTDIAKVVLPLGMDSLPARAVSSGLIERLSGDELKDGPGAPFSGSPRFALAMPILAAGETLAVVYADDAGAAKGRRPNDQSLVSARFAEAMQYHAVALLMRMSNELKARAELQTYAQSLLHELEEMYSADQQSGKQGDELQSRLKGNLDYARSIFDSRVALEGSGAGSLLDDEIGSLLESEPDTPFAQHLAAVSGRSVKSRNAAEAS